jgi:flagellar biosynthesis protein FlhB
MEIIVFMVHVWIAVWLFGIIWTVLYEAFKLLFRPLNWAWKKLDPDRRP